ncbi:hypothetical protein KC622_00815, partial [Candidatus Dojkabacteria bacterium]|nr:hypothetical protein [Candidatus Dojkabacteria bacterium]
MRIFLKEYSPESANQSKITSQFSTSFHPSNLGKDCYLVGLISISTETEIDAVSASRFIWNAISDQAHQTGIIDVNSVKDLVEEAVLKLKELVKNHDKTENFKISFDFSICSVSDGKIVFAQAGDHKLFVRRGGTLIDISKTLKENNVIGGSAALNESDIIVIASARSSLEDALKTGVNGDSADEFVLGIDASASHLANGEGVLLISQSVNFDEIIKTNRVEIDEETANVTSEKEEVTYTEKDSELPVSERIGLTETVTKPLIDLPSYEETKSTGVLTQEPSQDAVEISQESAIPQTALKGSIKSIKETVAKIILVLAPLNNLLGRVIKKLSPLIKSFSAKLKIYLEKLRLKLWSFVNATFGRKIWFKRVKAKISQSRISSPSLKGIRLGEYRASALRNKRFATLGAAVVVVIAVLMGIRATQNLKATKELAKEFNDFYSSTD